MLLMYSTTPTTRNIQPSMPRMRKPDLNQSEYLNNMKRKEPLKEGKKQMYILSWKDPQGNYIFEKQR